MSSKHTPGPWVVTPHPQTHVDVFGVGVIMEDREMQYALSHTFCYQNAKANARLIAAAPELLSVAYLADIVGDLVSHDPDSPLGGLVSAARAAIANVTGGAQ